MNTLSKAQKLTLTEIVTEEYGDSLEYEEFVEAVLTVCDDIAGFESIQTRRVNNLINSLWRHYHEY